MRIELKTVLTALLLAGLAGSASDDACAAETCFLKHQRASGLNTICTYDCISGEVAITISGLLCPLSIKR